MTRPPRSADITGLQFGRLTVMARAPRTGSAARWVCRCECGNETIAWGQNLRNGRSQSCGCRQKEAAAKIAPLAHAANTTHGKTNTPEFKAWRSIIDRCTNPNIEHFHNYGGRGITICERWMTFENFYSDVGNRPSPDHSIERINNNGNYEPSNCKWATRTEQANNRRTNRLIEYKGQTLTAAEAARLTGIPVRTIRQRLRRGWTDAASLSQT